MEEFIKFRSIIIVLISYSFLLSRIYIVHDEVKDKNFELELSWIGEGWSDIYLVSYSSQIQNAPIDTGNSTL